MRTIYSPNDFKECADDSEMIQVAVSAAVENGASVIIPRFNERM